MLKYQWDQTSKCVAPALRFLDDMDACKSFNASSVFVNMHEKVEKTAIFHAGGTSDKFTGGKGTALAGTGLTFAVLKTRPSSG